jgi:hypothetical protein
MCYFQRTDRVLATHAAGGTMPHGRGGCTMPAGAEVFRPVEPAHRGASVLSRTTALLTSMNLAARAGDR